MYDHNLNEIREKVEDHHKDKNLLEENIVLLKEKHTSINEDLNELRFKKNKIEDFVL